MYQYKKILGTILFLGSIVVALDTVHGADATSASFILRDPVVGGGGQSAGSSSSFQLLSNIDVVSIGRNNSASFEGRFGFQYYPYIQSGVLSSALNGGDVDLTWTASAADTGLQVSGYEVGIANVSGGPYTYTNVGNVTSYTYQDLAPGEYFFILKTLDGLSNPIAYSNEETEIVPQILSFAISDTTIGFGTLATNTTKYATGDLLGNSASSVAHQISASTNAPFGYGVAVSGSSLSNGVTTITPIGGTAVSPAVGTKQFGVRAAVSTGSGTVASPYNGTGFAYTNGSTIATLSTGANSSDVYDMFYIANIDEVTTSGSYTTELTYVLTATF